MKIATGMWILLGIVWIGLYWPLMVGQVPAFRDAFHFYYPLEVWLDQQRLQGDFFPQTNPLDGTGVNLVGEMSTGLFYPGRCLWWLPGLSVAQRMGLVLLVHTALSGIGAAYAAKRLRLGAAPQLLAASAYSLSGPVFFQHVNPIFLISSAWLPWALGECCVLAQTHRGSGILQEQETPTPTPTPTPSTSTSTSTSTNTNTNTNTNTSRSRSRSRSLSGEDEAVDRVRWGVWIAACSLMLLGGDPQGTFHCGLVAVVATVCAGLSTRSLKHFIADGSRLALAVLAVAGLGAIQILPTWYWYQAGLMEPALVNTAAVDGVPEPLQSIPPAKYDLARGSPYAYSVAPWHAVTLVWSNVLGHFLPQHTRYLSAWSAEPRMWTVSLSIGLMSLLLSVACLFNRQCRISTRYIWLIVLISGTAMLGNYAPVWMLRSGLRWFGMSTDWLPGDEVGGTYWLLTQLVPGYDAFRYPAKWSPLFAASLALCAAHGLDNWETTRPVFLRATRVVVSAVSFVFCALAVGLSRLAVVREVFERWTDQAVPDGWLGSIDAAAAISTIMSSLAIAWTISIVAWFVLKCMTRSWQPWLIVCLVVVELGWSAHQWLVTMPASQIAMQLPEMEGVMPTRIWAAAGQANFERNHSTSDSLADKLMYQSQFALAKLHLLDGRAGNLSAFMTLTPKSLAHVRHHLAQHDRLAVDNAQLDEALAWLGVQWRLVRSDGLQWQAVERALPLLELASDEGSRNTLYVKYFGPSRIGLQSDTASRQKLVVRLFQDGGWQAVLRDASGTTQVVTPQVSHLGLFQSFDVPAGTWDIELRYQAPGLMLGAWISGVTLLLAIFCQIIFCQMNHRTKN